MCGIGGIIYKDKNKENYHQIADDIILSQNKRGPDYSGKLEIDNSILIHNRLSIIDLSVSANQPMIDGNNVIVFNGEIYNFLELKNELIAHNIEFQTTSDTEVLLKMFRIFQPEEVLNKLNGMFSFCFYDGSVKKFIMARDRTGEKPFYYYKTNDEFYFASNIASLLKSIKNVNWKASQDGLYEYFSLGGFFTTNTIIKDIYKLDAGHYIEIQDNVFNIKKYWTPNKHSVSKSSFKDYIRSSIRNKIVADVPISLFLSGGVDSSCIASIIQNIDMVHLDSEEKEYARKVAEKYNANFNIISPYDFSIQDTLLDYSDFSGEPTMSGFIPYITSKFVSQNYKVGISANGADELFFGYTRIQTPNLLDSFYDNLLKESRINTNGRAMTKDNQIWNIFRNPNNIQFKYSNNNYSTYILDIINNYNLEGFSDSAKSRWLEIQTYIKGDLNPTLDFATMANSIEMRCPFLDYKLIELALNLDDHEHITEKNSRKSILKEILVENDIDRNIWDRDKVGFSLNASFLFHIESLKDIAENWCKENNIIEFNGNSYFYGRDKLYLRSAMLGFYFWKIKWVDTGLVSL